MWIAGENHIFLSEYFNPDDSFSQQVFPDLKLLYCGVEYVAEEITVCCWRAHRPVSLPYMWPICSELSSAGRLPIRHHQK
ncbi:hypothetical protein GDO81_001872 [Engystomops pustulosus]|uniref:Uncharacterized protein n=1 Tax=Engystomops pustulosus TaxID=76066 RepID=A0AAV7DI18_ENGPU|nr:hypothetical protein GDO81_001872 [Engystomops pustulosus]